MDQIQVNIKMDLSQTKGGGIKQVKMSLIRWLQLKLRTGYGRILAFPVLRTALPGLKHGEKTEGHITGLIDMNQVVDSNIPKMYATELGEMKNKI